MSLPRYEEYKDSGIDWIGSIPTHWAVQPIKRGFSLVGGATPKSDEAAYWDGEIVWVSPADLSRLPSMYIAGSGRTISVAGLNSCGTTMVPLGSIVLSTRAPIGSLAIAATTLCTNQGCKSLVPGVLASSHYYAYVLLSATIPLNLRGKGTTFLELSADELAAFKVPCPTLKEQAAIAAFLDRETAKIDALIAEQEKLIALLAEKRQATISHAVTKGIKPNAPMKDSGVAWLGEVPAHWEVAQLKRLCNRITDGAHISPETEGGTYSFVSTKDLDGDSINFENCLLTSPSSFDYLQRTGCRPAAGDVLFSKDGTIGRTVVVRDGREFVVASSLIIITPSAGMLDSDFLNYLCKSSIISGQVEGFVKGAGLPRLSIQNLLKVVGLFPPIDEQLAISAHLKVETRKFDVLSAAAERSVALLKERRAALITAAVTGQVDVCVAVSHAPTERLEAIAA